MVLQSGLSFQIQLLLNSRLLQTLKKKQLNFPYTYIDCIMQISVSFSQILFDGKSVNGNIASAFDKDQSLCFQISAV